MTHDDTTTILFSLGLTLGMVGIAWAFWLSIGRALHEAAGDWWFELRNSKAIRHARRTMYQQAIRQCIEEMVCTPVLIDDLEWHLHELLYEYRRA